MPERLAFVRNAPTPRCERTDRAFEQASTDSESFLEAT
jgi:hypothetical protein